MSGETFGIFPTLKTARLTLRQLSIEDEQDVFILRSDVEVNRFLDRQRCTSIDEARDFINKVNEHVNAGCSLYWAITLNDTDKLVGTICLYDISMESAHCEIGYELLPEFQGRGFMKEAAEMVIGYAFHAIKAKSIGAVLHRDNQRSIQLLEKLLFKQSGGLSLVNSGLIAYHLISSTPDSL
jgi:[ribosomal protein S5]-alanine N-acetyltransferase